jgi:hypothetical protein
LIGGVRDESTCTQDVDAVGLEEVRDMSRPRTERDARRASASLELKRALSLAGVTIESVAECAGVSPTLARKWTQEEEHDALPLADAISLPLEVRLALAQWLAGSEHVVSLLPDAACAPDDLRLLGAVQRQAAAAVSAGLDALADGHMCAAEGAALVPLCNGAIAPLLTLRAVALAAQSRRAISMHGGGK